MGGLTCVISVDIIGIMYTPPPDPADEPSAVAQFLAQPIEAIWHAFDRGRAAADEFFSADDKKYDSHLWAHIARYEAVASLRAATHDDYAVSYLGHSGISITMSSVRVRVCKAIDQGPQSPGRSHRKREFFQQLGLALWGGDSALNLILYWRVGTEGLQLGLCKPRGIWKFRAQPKLEWDLPITYDPLAGLTFAGDETADVDVSRIRFDLDDLGTGTSE